MGAPVPFPSESQFEHRDLLLANPAAGGGRAAKAFVELKQFARKRDWGLDFRETDSAEALAAEACHAKAQGYSRIFILGGDGTFQVVLNAVGVHADLALAILPAGSGNDLAAALGLPMNALRAAELLLNGETGFLDAARVRCADGVERLYCGGGGVGLDAKAARYAGGIYRKVPGRWRYIFSALHALLGFRGVTVRATIEGEEAPEWSGKALLLAALNTPSYGAGLRIAPEAEYDDGLLDLVMIERLNLFEVLTILPALALRGEVRTKRIRRARVKNVKIRTASECQFHGDGEIIGTTPVEIDVVPQAVRIVKPEREAEHRGPE
jgi:diacylglycerol kinase (ATP)